MDAPKRERGAYIERQKNPRQWHIISLARVTTPPPPSLLLPAATVGYQSLHQSILPTSTPLPFKYQAPQVGARGDGEKRPCLMRRSPQLHGASASPACRHAAIHRLITMEERSSRWVKVGCTDCNQLPVAVFFFFFMHCISHFSFCALHSLQCEKLQRADKLVRWWKRESRTWVSRSMARYRFYILKVQLNDHLYGTVSCYAHIPIIVCHYMPWIMIY